MGEYRAEEQEARYRADAPVLGGRPAGVEGGKQILRQQPRENGCYQEPAVVQADRDAQ